MTEKHIILKGTFVLTLAAFISRFLGFFYRMYLSHTFGEANVGLYQLIFPVYTLGIAITCAGIQTALSRHVAGYVAKGKKKETDLLLFTSMIYTVFLSVILMLFTQHYAHDIACTLLKEPACKSLLLLLSYCFPFAAIHCCILGYYFGMKQAKIPAWSQLLEQSVRILSVYAVYSFGIRHGQHFSVSVAVLGMIAGEAAAAWYCLHSLNSYSETLSSHKSTGILFLRRLCCLDNLKAFLSLLRFSIPLTVSRIMLTLLQCLEAFSIPWNLQYYGLDRNESLRIYGVLTGMALPCVLFPSALTGSLATMILPSVAQIEAENNTRKLRRLIRKVTTTCILLGSTCCILLLLSSSFIGVCLFHSPLASRYIFTLAWICPFLYTNTTFISILNGIGKADISLFINMFTILIRIASIYLSIPAYGIRGYLTGLLLSQIFMFCFCFIYLHYHYRFSANRRTAGLT